MLLGVDVGGTFTDAVIATAGRIVSAKAPTTPADQSIGVMAAIEGALRAAGADATDVTAFAHGMTVATNALLEGTGARTAFIATEGFTDVIELARQNRPELYRLCAARAGAARSTGAPLRRARAHRSARGAARARAARRPGAGDQGRGRRTRGRRGLPAARLARSRA